jgi:hypothetical protein
LERGIPAPISPVSTKPFQERPEYFSNSNGNAGDSQEEKTADP